MALIKVALGGHTEYTEKGHAYNPSNQFGFMDERDLRKEVNTWDNENETGEAVEYWDGNVIRHRSVSLVLKRGLDLPGLAGKLG